MTTRAGYYRPSSAKTLVLVKEGDQIPSSWAYIGTLNPEGWPVTVFMNPAQPPSLSTSSPPSVYVPPNSTQVVPTISSSQPAISANIADGSTYLLPNGSYYQSANTGFGLPDSWQRTSSPPAGAAIVVDPLTGTGISTTKGDSRVSTGGQYLTPGGTVVSYPAGNPVPAAWIDLSIATNIDITGKPVVQAPDAAAIVANYKAMQTLSTIAGIAGVAGLIWLGTSVIFDPEGAAKILSTISNIKTLLVDSGTIMAVVLGLAGIGFLSYEFASSYVKNNYDIAATLADLLSSFLVTILSAIVDSVVDFCKKIADAISSAIF